MPTLNLGKVKGDDGASVYIKYNSVAADAGASDSFLAGAHKFVGILVSTSKTKPISGYTWAKFVGDNGAPGTNGTNGLPGVPGTNGTNGTNGADGKNCHIKFNTSASITGATDSWVTGQNYIGFALSNSVVAPTLTTDYKWSKFIDDAYKKFSFIGEIKEFDYTNISTVTVPTADRFDTKAKVEAYFGGIWEAYGPGRVLVGVGTSDQSFPTVGNTGGASTHILTDAQMPKHGMHLSHSPWGKGETTRFLSTGGTSTYGSGGRGWNVHGGNEVYPAGFETGSGTSHNNLQPYIIVYRWRRIA